MSTAVLSPPATAAPTLPDLILLRLLPATKSVGAAVLRKDLAAVSGRPPGTEAVAEAVAGLRAEGFLTPRGNRLSDAGRARALQFLGLGELPPRTSWAGVTAKFLVPRALGLDADAAEYVRTADAGRLAAFLLKRELGLPNAGDTVAAVVDALLCRELGHPQFASLNALVRATLGKAVGGGPLAKADAAKALPRVKLNAKSGRKEHLCAAVLAGTRPKPVEPEPAGEEPFDLEAFANTVKAVARTCPTGRFGGYKVFISHVWEQLRDEPRFRPLGPDGFKAELIEANRARLLTLSRADLVQLMDPADVRASETTYLTATFHFILVEGS